MEDYEVVTMVGHKPIDLDTPMGKLPETEAIMQQIGISLFLSESKVIFLFSYNILSNISIEF